MKFHGKFWAMKFKRSFDFNWSLRWRHTQFFPFRWVHFYTFHCKAKKLTAVKNSMSSKSQRKTSKNKEKINCRQSPCNFEWNSNRNCTNYLIIFHPFGFVIFSIQKLGFSFNSTRCDNANYGLWKNNFFNTEGPKIYYFNFLP